MSFNPYLNGMFEKGKGNINFASGGDTFKVALMTSSYTPDLDNDDFWSDISADEASGTGYTAGGQTLANQAWAKDVANNRAYLDGDNISWPASSIVARYGVLYKDTGTPATSPLIALIDFGADKQSVSSTFLIEFDSTGIFEDVRN
jgi:hypothetical protein